MLKVIINADDLGQSQRTNRLIEEFIDNGAITSTTIMANREDTDEAGAIYKRHKDHVSSGVHLNIDSGRAMAPYQELVDLGFYSENDGVWMMNGGAIY